MSTKTKMKLFLSGAHNFMEKTQPLSGYHLNLASWYGFQEIIYKEPITPRSMEFRFWLADASYFYLIFNKDEIGFSGIRISTNPLYGCLYFDASDRRDFIKKMPFSFDGLEPGRWNDLKVVFSSSTASLILNGQAVQSFASSFKEKQYVGFIGSSENVLIDDIIIRGSSDDRVFKESFFNFWMLFFCCVACIVVFGLAIGWFVVIPIARSKNPPDVIREKFFESSRILIVALIAAYCNFLKLGHPPDQK